jgi:ferrous iron transport protein A
MGQDVPLAMIAAGETVVVTEVKAGRGLQGRLAGMGLTPGVRIKVLNSQASGPMLIDLRGSRVALGRGIAQRIVVKRMRA